MSINGCGGDELGNVGAFRLKRRGVAELSGVGIGIESLQARRFSSDFPARGPLFRRRILGSTVVCPTVRQGESRSSCWMMWQGELRLSRWTSCSGRRARPSSSPELLQPRRDRFRRRIPICRVLVRWIGLPLMFRLGRFRWLSRTRRGHLRWSRLQWQALVCRGFFSLELVVGAS